MPRPRPTVTRRERRSGEEQRSRILAAARAEFVKSGFAGTKMRDIAAVADINDALLYRHFESKAQLFDEAVYAPLEQMVAHSFAPASSEEDIRVVAERFVEELLEWMGEILPLLTVVLADSQRGQAFYRDRLRPALDDVAEATRANFGRWDHQEFDPDILIRLVWGGCWFLALDERFGEMPVAPKEAVKPLLDIIWEGVRARSKADQSDLDFIGDRSV